MFLVPYSAWSGNRLVPSVIITSFTKKAYRIQSLISGSLSKMDQMRQMECRVYYCQRLTRCRSQAAQDGKIQQLSLSTRIAILTFFISRNIGRVSSYLTSTKASNLIATNNPYEVYFIIYGGRIRQCHGICSIVGKWEADTVSLSTIISTWQYSTTAYSFIPSYTLYSRSSFVVSIT